MYKGEKEYLPYNLPEALGVPVILAAYMDENFLHDVTTHKSVTSILHLINKNPIEWFTRRQPTVDMDTYGSSTWCNIWKQSRSLN